MATRSRGAQDLAASRDGLRGRLHGTCARYAPRTAQERLRVARTLGGLPELTAALAQGELSYSAVRELTRVATPATEAEWRQSAVGKTLRQIEELVADHRPGDNPNDPGDPEARTHVVRFELSAETFAVLRQARQALDAEHGSHLSDDELVAALSGAVLDCSTATQPTGRARFQIAVTVCAGHRPHGDHPDLRSSASRFTFRFGGRTPSAP